MPKKPTELSIPSPASLIDGDSALHLSPAAAAMLHSLKSAIERGNELFLQQGIAKEAALTQARFAMKCEFLLGRHLVNLKESLAHGEFGKLFSDGAAPSSTGLRFNFTSRTGQKAMAFHHEFIERVRKLEDASFSGFLAALNDPHSEPDDTLLANALETLPGHTLRQCQEHLGIIPRTKQDEYGTNNPGGKNGGKRKPAASPGALLEERRRLARLDFFGTENPGKIKPGSPVWHMEEFLKNPAEHPLSLLPKPELLDLIENTLTPFIKALKKLTA